MEGKRCLNPVRDVEAMPYDVFVFGLVSCHSLTIINKQITGDPLDLKVRIFLVLKFCECW